VRGQPDVSSGYSLSLSIKPLDNAPNPPDHPRSITPCAITPLRDHHRHERPTRRAVVASSAGSMQPAGASALDSRTG